MSRTQWTKAEIKRIKASGAKPAKFNLLPTLDLIAAKLIVACQATIIAPLTVKGVKLLSRKQWTGVPELLKCVRIDGHKGSHIFETKAGNFMFETQKGRK
jgi:hypothetical protein